MSLPRGVVLVLLGLLEVGPWGTVLDARVFFLLLFAPGGSFNLRVGGCRKKLGLQATDPLPDDCDLAYVCQSHRGLCEFVVDPVAKSLNSFAVGHQRIQYDDTNGDVYCASQPERSATSRQLVTPPSPGKQKKKKHPGHMDCAQTKLRGFHLLGNMLKLFDTYYVMCPRCASICKYEFYKNIGPTFWCLNCASTPGKQVVEDVRCEFCAKPMRKNDLYFSIRVFDDLKTKRIRNINLCRIHFRHQYGNYTHLRQLSVLFASISADFTSMIFKR